MELQKYMEDITNAVEEIEDGVKDRHDELAAALDKANNFDSTLQVSATVHAEKSVHFKDFTKLRLRQVNVFYIKSIEEIEFIQ